MGIKSGKYFYGRLMMSRIVPDEGTVAVSHLDRPLVIKGKEKINRAINADMVCLEILPENDWIEEEKGEAGKVDAAHLLNG